MKASDPHPASLASWQAVESATEGLCVVPCEVIGFLARYNGGPICGGACPLAVAASVLEGVAYGYKSVRNGVGGEVELTA